MTAWRLCLLAVSAVLAFSATSPAARQGQSPQKPTFRTGVDLVAVDVSVTRGGDPVGGLKPENFTVFDNGVKQALDKVVMETVPLECYLVLDMSGSVQGPELADLKRAATAFVAGLTGQDKVALITFNAEARLVQPLTSNFPAFLDALNAVQAGGNTALYDAAYRAITTRRPRPDNRAVVVVFTDGYDNASSVQSKVVVQAAEHSDVIAYGVSVGDAGGGSIGGMGFRPLAAQFQIGFLRSLAEATGGRLFRAEYGRHLEETFALILDDVRARYVLTYYPAKVAPGWHKLEVKLVNAKGDVLARRGYWAGPTGQRP
jgi:VWFA-related protein